MSTQENSPHSRGPRARLEEEIAEDHDRPEVVPELKEVACSPER